MAFQSRGRPLKRQPFTGPPLPVPGQPAAGRGEILRPVRRRGGSFVGIARESPSEERLDRNWIWLKNKPPVLGPRGRGRFSFWGANPHVEYEVFEQEGWQLSWKNTARNHDHAARQSGRGAKIQIIPHSTDVAPGGPEEGKGYSFGQTRRIGYHFIGGARISPTSTEATTAYLSIKTRIDRLSGRGRGGARFLPIEPKTGAPALYAPQSKIRQVKPRDEKQRILCGGTGSGRGEGSGIEFQVLNWWPSRWKRAGWTPAIRSRRALPKGGSFFLGMLSHPWEWKGKEIVQRGEKVPRNIPKETHATGARFLGIPKTSEIPISIPDTKALRRNKTTGIEKYPRGGSARRTPRSIEVPIFWVPASAIKIAKRREIVPRRGFGKFSRRNVNVIEFANIESALRTRKNRIDRPPRWIWSSAGAKFEKLIRPEGSPYALPWVFRIVPPTYPIEVLEKNRGTKQAAIPKLLGDPKPDPWQHRSAKTRLPIHRLAQNRGSRTASIPRHPGDPRNDQWIIRKIQGKVHESIITSRFGGKLRSTITKDPAAFTVPSYPELILRIEYQDPLLIRVEYSQEVKLNMRYAG